VRETVANTQTEKGKSVIEKTEEKDEELVKLAEPRMRLAVLIPNVAVSRVKKLIV